MTETLTKISAFFKSVQGILISVGVVISFIFSISGYIAKHDAKVIKRYVDTTQIKTDVRFASIENQLISLTESVNGYIAISNSNFITVKKEFQNHIHKSKELKPDERLNDILNVVNGIYTEVKKKE